MNKLFSLSWYGKKGIIGLFFAGLLTIGLSTFQDYGLSWDEPTERLTGLVNLNHIGKTFNIPFIKNAPAIEAIRDIKLETYSDRVFGPLFPTMSAAIEILFAGDIQTAYLIRHFLTFISFIFSTFVIFKIAEIRFRNWKFALLIALMLFLSPRIYGEAFYNSKDIIFLALFNLSIYTLIRAYINFSYGNLIFHGIATALAINIRSIGFIIIPLTIFIFLTRVRKDHISPKIFFSYLLYLLVALIVTIILWPWLWESPLDNLIKGITTFSHWITKIQILYFGKLISIQEESIPWHYSLVWIGITTPIIFIIFWALGYVKIITTFITSPLESLRHQDTILDIIFAIICTLPIMGIILLNSIIYDGWRHLYFIYPSFLLIAGSGITIIWSAIKSNSFLRSFFIIGLIISIGNLGITIIKLHPHQNTYFNYIAGENLIEKFDVDYWGLSNRQALEWIARNDYRPKLTISDGSIMALESSMIILPDWIKNRLRFTGNIITSDYVITNYRGNFTNYAESPYNFKLAHEIYSGKEKILSIFKNIRNLHVNKLYSKNDTINFSKNSIGDELFGHGWGYPEYWGTWAEGKIATVVIPITSPHPNNIRVQLQAFLSENIATQNFSVQINDQKPIPISMVTPHLAINIPVQKPNHSNMIVLTLNKLNPIQPSSLGLGDDNRNLSIGIISISLE